MSIKRILAVKGSHVITIKPGATISDAAHIMTSRRIGALVVTDRQERIVGIISERDILYCLDAETVDLKRPVSDIMTKEVVTGVPQDDIHAVAHIMTERRFRHLPVVMDEKLIGIISIGDVLKAQRDSYRGEIDTLETQILANDD